MDSSPNDVSFITSPSLSFITFMYTQVENVFCRRQKFRMSFQVTKSASKRRVEF